MRVKVISAQQKTCQVGWHDDDSHSYGSDEACISWETSGKVTIPSKVNGYTVTTIGGGAFYWCPYITSISIPKSVTTIKTFAFSDCYELSALEIPNTVTEIDYWAFSGCSFSSLKVESGNPVYDSRNNCNAIVESATNTLIAGCRNTIIPASVTSLGTGAFFSSDIESITIPKSVSFIGLQTFAYCENLQSISVEQGNPEYDSRNDCNAIIRTSSKELLWGSLSTKIPDDVVAIGYDAFSSRALTTIDIPESVVTIDEYAFENCPSLETITLPKNITSIGNSAFEYCYKLETVYSAIPVPFTIADDVFGYYDWESGGTKYPSTLYVPIGTKSLYEKTDYWYNFGSIVETDKLPGQQVTKGQTLVVVDADGQDVTSQVSVVWSDADGKTLGNGSTIKGIAEGTKLFYSILLDSELGSQYREAKDLGGSEPNDSVLTCQLEKIGKVTLQGRVSAASIERAGVTVRVVQKLNGKYEKSFTAQVNEQGLFSVEIFDDESDITIGGEGYLNTTLHRNSFNGNGNIGTINLNMISGCMASANIYLQSAAPSGVEAESSVWADGLNNIDLMLTNMTRGSAVTDFTVQNNSVIIKTGAEKGDEIRVEASSKQGVFAKVSTTFVVGKDDSSFCLLLKELGGIDATYTTSRSNNVAGYFYNSSGLLTAKGSYDGETLALRHLVDGDYTLISIGNGPLFGSLTTIGELSAIGLTEGTDYVATQVKVENGILTKVSIAEIPKMDSSRFSYTTGNTYFNVSKSSVTAGSYQTVSAHVDFKPEYIDKIETVTLSVNLPEGCEVVDNSVIANRQSVAYTVNNHQLSMMLSKEQFGSQVRFCVMPTQNTNHTLTGIATFKIDDEVSQPIGTAQFEVKGLTIEVPAVTATPKISINGTALGHSEISIFDNGVFIGKATSLANGLWTSECELYKPYNHSYHNIHAKIVSDKGLELTSESRQVEYSKADVVAEKVTMIYYNPEFDKDYNIVFDLVNGTATPSFYYYFPYKNWPDWWQTYETEPKDFTFLASFNTNDSSVVKNVNVKVLNSDGTIRTLPAAYDGNRKCWVATTKYASTSRLPNNVTVEYEAITKYSDEDRQEALSEQAGVLASCAASIAEFFDKDVEMVTVEEDENHALLACKVGQDDELMYYRIENIGYQVADEMMKSHQFVFIENDDHIIGTFTETTDAGIAAYVVDVLDSAACKISLYGTAPAESRAMADETSVTRKAIQALQESVGSGRFLDGFGKAVGVLGTLLNIKEYWNVKGDFDNMCNVILRYADNLEQVNKRTFDMPLAKCPDGSYRLSQADMNRYYGVIQTLTGMESTFQEQYYKYLDQYKKKLGLSVGTFVVTLGLGKAIGAMGKAAKFINSKMNMAFYGFLNKHFNSYVFRTTSASILSSTIGAGVGFVGWGTDKIFSYKDFNGVRDKALSWASGEYSGLLRNYVDLQNSIKKSYKKCEKDSQDEETDKPADNDEKSKFRGEGTRDIQDPSGYVYEAVLSNRLEGVTATCYYRAPGEDKNGSAATEEAVLWNAADYSQVNPQTTDYTGFYRWDVPQGMWQVKYEKEGYETAYSEWLPVPPPQLDVNIGMKQSTPPAVNPMRGTESGITVELTKYMRPATMTAANITVTRNGVSEKGTVELLNAEQAPLGGETFVSKVKFVPEERFSTSDVVVVTVHKEVESYCGVPMAADHVETVKIESELKGIVVDEEITLDYQGEKELTIAVQPRDAAAGRTLRVKTSSAMIVSVSADEQVLDENGAARITIGGELPGGAVLTFSADGAEITATSKVNVMAGRELVAMPESSIRSGEAVEGGTVITLSCETEGATIFYTLDGTCPCDETTRIKYEGPIVVGSSITVKAIAVKEGLDDSDVATFVYFLDKKSMGDVDLNGVVDVADMALTVDHVLKRTLQKESALERMDMNVDGHVDVGDVILIVKKILDGGGVVSMPAESRGAAEAIDLTRYTAMQFTVSSSAGAKVTDIRLTGTNSKTHQLMYREMPDGSCVVVVFSLSNAMFSKVDRSMLDVVVEGNGEVATSQVLLTTPDGVRRMIDSLPESQVTGISPISADGVATADVYDLRGYKVLSEGESFSTLPAGVYVMNGKKIIK